MPSVVCRLRGAGEIAWQGNADLDISAYLARIGYDGDRTPTRQTLAAVQRAHLLAIPYENLDVQLGRPRTTAVSEAYAKMVGGAGAAGATI